MNQSPRLPRQKPKLYHSSSQPKLKGLALNKAKDDALFLRVCNWSQCSRCIWHLQHLMKTINFNDDNDSEFNINNDNDIKVEYRSPINGAFYLDAESMVHSQSLPTLKRHSYIMSRSNNNSGPGKVKYRQVNRFQNDLDSILFKNRSHSQSPNFNNSMSSMGNSISNSNNDLFGSLNQYSSGINSKSMENNKHNVIPIGYYTSTDYDNRQKLDKITLTENTALRFLYNEYRIVITLDITSSIAVMNSCNFINFEIYYPILRDILYTIVQPIKFKFFFNNNSNNNTYYPILYFCIIAVGLPNKKIKLLYNNQISINNLDDIIIYLYNEMKILQNDIINALSDANKKGRTLTTKWKELIDNSIFCLDRLPLSACPIVIIITDGIIKLGDRHILLNELLRQDIELTIIQTNDKAFSQNIPFGYVPDTDSLEFFSRFTNGLLLDYKTLHEHSKKYYPTNNMDKYMDIFNDENDIFNDDYSSGNSSDILNSDYDDFKHNNGGFVRLYSRKFMTTDYVSFHSKQPSVPIKWYITSIFYPNNPI